MKLCVLGIHDREVCVCRHCDKPKHKLIEVNGKEIERIVLKQYTKNGVVTSIIRRTSEVYYRCRRCDHRETRIEIVVLEGVSDAKGV
jgi:pyrroloquinoline quinone (PQQ) biosynthesis protein C